MHGVVLCGGQSSRMGTDKGLIKPRELTWAQVAFEKMAALKIDVVLSVNGDQFSRYAEIFPAPELIRDNKTIDIKGPLLGVLSVHLQYPSEDLFVLACDMPLMEIHILNLLMDHYKKQAAEAWVFTTDDAYEPLCGIYTARGLSRILQQQKTNQLVKHSMKYVLENLNTAAVPLADDQKKYFRNFNSPLELKGL